MIDTPLAESAIVGVAIGMSMNGMMPVAEIQFADFIHPAFDQLVSEAARIRYRSNGDWNVPMVVRTPYGGGVHGALYHSQSIEAFYGHVPGLKVVVPATPYDVKGMLRAAIRDPDPVLFLEHKKTYRLIKGDVPDEPYEVPIGVAEVKRDRRPADRDRVRADAPLLPGGGRAARSEEGISAEVVDVRTIAPLDKKTILDSVRKTAKAMVVYEDNRTYGAGAEIIATIAEELLFDLDGPLVRMGGPDIPAMPFSSQLEHVFMPDPQRIYEQDEGAGEVLAEGEAPEPLAGDLVVLRELTPDDADALLELRLRNQDFLRPLEPIRPDGFLTPGEPARGPRVGAPTAQGGPGVRLRDLRGRRPAPCAGRIALSNIVRGAWRNCTVGYYVDQERNGRGYATEALGWRPGSPSRTPACTASRPASCRATRRRSASWRRTASASKGWRGGTPDQRRLGGPQHLRRDGRGLAAVSERLAPRTLIANGRGRPQPARTAPLPAHRPDGARADAPSPPGGAPTGSRPSSGPAPTSSI